MFFYCCNAVQCFSLLVFSWEWKTFEETFLCGITSKLWTDENWVLNCQFSLHDGKIPTHWVDIFFVKAFFFCTCVFMRFLFSLFILSCYEPYIDTNRCVVKKMHENKIALSRPFTLLFFYNYEYKKGYLLILLTRLTRYS